MTRLLKAVLLAPMILLAVGAFFPLSAQDADTALVRAMVSQRLGREVSQAEILEQLRQSGLSRAEVRARLQQLGLNPALADPYFDALERGGELPGGTPSGEFVEGLRRAGLVASPERDTLSPTSGRPPTDAALRDSTPRDSISADDAPADTLAPGELPVFGRSFFRHASTQFQPTTAGPVDPDYRLGPEDEIILVITGDVELAYNLRVTREGFIVIPDVGQVSVNGLTLRELEDRLYDRLSRVYSGVRRDPSATTRFQVSLGRLRTNQVYVVGEVVRPGAYQVAATATVFHALYQAGGPSDNGTFRRIEVRRGGRVIRVVDLYDYLLYGDSRGDIRLEHGDIIFVPIIGPTVTVEGEVRRPAIYELKGGEDVRQLLAYAGGPRPEALLRRVQIDRILPPSQRQAGVDRVLVDVDVERLEANQEVFPLQGGDVVRVFAVSDERRHRITVTGQVRRPGVYEWVEGMTLWQLIERAQGLDERAYTPRAHIFRLNEDDGTRRLIRTPLLADTTGRPLQDVLLADRDSIVIYSQEQLRNPALVTIDGFIKRPGTYVLAEGMTVKDLILAAGGFAPGAYQLEVDVARQRDTLARSDTTALRFRVSLDSGGPASSGTFGFGTGARATQTGDIPIWVPDSTEFELRHGDHVFVRKAPGYEPARIVKITGEVMLPGTYVLGTRRERLAELIQHAGGLTGEAYAPGLQVYRKGLLLSIDAERALRDPRSHFNLVLEPGDSIHVPRFDPTVVVTGAVGFESRVVYRPGEGLDYYIDQAGGYAENADRGRVSVTYQNGERKSVGRKLLFFRQKPVPQPGSTIFVPQRPESKGGGFNWDQFITRSLSIVSTTLTILIASRELSK
ncbi:MAG TPA: SLBB domain-containing protein [Longimicrobiales bacterium]